jgi:hypothetical protein
MIWVSSFPPPFFFSSFLSFFVFSSFVHFLFSFLTFLLPSCPHFTPSLFHIVLSQAPCRFKTQTEISGEWIDLYYCNLDPAHTIDIQLGNHWVSTAPVAKFVNNVVLVRLDTRVIELIRRSLSGVFTLSVVHVSHSI